MAFTQQLQESQYFFDITNLLIFLWIILEVLPKVQIARSLFINDATQEIDLLLMLLLFNEGGRSSEGIKQLVIDGIFEDGRRDSGSQLIGMKLLEGSVQQIIGGIRGRLVAEQIGA